MDRRRNDLTQEVGPVRVDTNETRSLWVIGHRVTLIPVGGRIAVIEVVTQPGIPGPPPHHHEGTDECFYVISGRLGVKLDDVWTQLEPGEYVNVPRGTVHTFGNEGPDEARVITGFEPQGFERFFLEYGVDADEPEAFEASVSAAAIARVVEGCAQFGMILAPT